MWKGFKKKTIMLNGEKTEVLVPTRTITHEEAWERMKPILDEMIANEKKRRR